MLGKLARWLRLLGHNVVYSSRFDDKELIDIAKNEKRILLTRDFELYKQAIAKELETFYVNGRTEAESLGKLANRFGIELDVNMKISRCTKCNVPVKPIPKKKAEGKVEKTTFVFYYRFWQCPKCGQIYWQGAHWTKINKTLKNATSILKAIQKQKSLT